ncbi:MAG: homoserine dehydrogenase [Clostridiales bacterium]|nr:homoserine dehydrogenase [Clostridiales bacterium]
MKTIKIGLMGLGNIGTGTYKLLEMNRRQIESAAGAHISIDKIFEKDVEKDRGISVDPSKFTQDPDSILKDPGTDIVIELLGGIQPATDFMLEAMNNKKHVVTANKAAIAASFDKLSKCSEENGVAFRFEASTGGGIPILNAITTALQANEFHEVLGIVNGTTNYILTQMSDFGLGYEDALKSAQAKGFAEADPTADVEGSDSANKLTILMALMFGKYVKPEDIPTEGISKITKAQIEEAKASGCRIKLLASARIKDGKLEYGVEPVVLKNDHPLAGVGNEFNAIFVSGNAVGDLMFYGKGAGPLPTASAVLGDVIQIARASKTIGGE